MASPAEIETLVNAQRLAQNRVAAMTTTEMLSISGLLDVSDLDRSFPGWLRMALTIIGRWSAKSGAIAASYYGIARRLEINDDGFVPVVVAAPAAAAVTTSLLVTGPAAIKSAVASGRPVAEAFDRAVAGSARAAARHAVSSGRATLDGSIAADRAAIGSVRVTSGSPCHFCAMLASRGPIYKDDGGPRKTRVHDGCGCITKPVFTRSSPWLGESLRYRDLWQESTAGLSGNDAVNAFRRALNE